MTKRARKKDLSESPLAPALDRAAVGAKVGLAFTLIFGTVEFFRVAATQAGRMHFLKDWSDLALAAYGLPLLIGLPAAVLFALAAGPLARVDLARRLLDPLGRALIWLAVFCAVFAALSWQGYTEIEAELSPGRIAAKAIAAALAWGAASATAGALHRAIHAVEQGLARRRAGRGRARAKGGRWLIGAVVSAFLLLVGTLWVWNEYSSPGVRELSKPPVILIVIDALRPDHLGAYGYRKETSPALDTLAREGIVFNDAVSAAPWTMPSIASLFTSQPVIVHGVDDYGSVLSGAFETLAERFKAAGYATGGFTANPTVDAKHGYAQGFDNYVTLKKVSSELFLSKLAGVAGLSRKYAHVEAGLVNDRVLRWLRAHADEPFFLFIFYKDPHYPYYAPPDYIRRFADEETQARYGRVWDFIGEYNRKEGRKDGRIDPEVLGYAEALYDAEIRFVDDAIGRLFARLRDWKIYDRSMIVVTSDHGEAFLEHGMKFHGNSLHREEIRVPLLLKVPGGGERGRVEGPVRMTDIYPTVLDYAGIDVPAGIRGVVLRSWIEGEPGRPPLEISARVNKKRHRADAYRMGAWKLIFDREAIHLPGDTGIFLYNLATDPGERINLAGQGVPAEDRLRRALLSRYREDLKDAAKRKVLPIDPEREEDLRALGYID